MNTKLCATALLVVGVGLAACDTPPQNDGLNGTLWLQSSVENKANALATYRLGTMMLDAALADKSWTAAPNEQKGDFSGKPPAIILDVDETVLDNSVYQSWVVTKNTHYSSKTWGPFVNDIRSRPIPGSLDFIKTAVAKGIKIFYVTNRKAPLEAATRKNLAVFGYPIDTSEDTVLTKGEKKAWKSSKKSPRRAHVAKNYRVLMVFGDNFGDFVDGYKGSLAERHALYQKHDAMWGTKWFMLANPSYGSWESSAFGNAWGKPLAVRRQMKLDALDAWKPK
ncbi:MAG: HAD family acid phosphatase [Alphaproteobacteria bacterium]|jgi:acid phosphatase|nr:HAD family acid phosphatase [Alphaproteobacteria bacterium]MDP6874578.1 HAD family acid phosphatase [Alphaproteobacteria bacterium]